MDQMEQIGTAELGNTKPTPPRTKMSKRWTVTFFGSDKMKIVRIFRDVTDIGFIGSEICPSTKKRHLQCYFEFKKRIRPLENKSFKDLKGHWEIAKSDIEKNYNYCSKEGDFIKWGYEPPKVVDFLIKDEDLNDDQMEIADLFREDEDPKFGRKIYWFYEEKGGWGKSVLATYMVDQMGAIMVSGAKKDILYGVSTMVQAEKFPRLIVVDIPRVNQGAISIQGIEMIKNGMFYNEKYESGMCRFPRPHIVCFANCPPDTSKMSEDRWVVRNLRPDYVKPPDLNKCLIDEYAD
jgi:hypothetical protein